MSGCCLNGWVEQWLFIRTRSEAPSPKGPRKSSYHYSSLATGLWIIACGLGIAARGDSDSEAALSPELEPEAEVGEWDPWISVLYIRIHFLICHGTVILFDPDMIIFLSILLH